MNVIELIIEEIKDNLAELFIDNYANYFCQKLILSASSEQRFKILQYFAKDFVLVSCDDVGTHSMQRFVEIINREEEIEIIFKAIQGDIVNLAFHEQGNYVLLLLIGMLHGAMLDYIVEQLIDYIMKLYNSAFGICILNKMIQLTPNMEHKARIVDILAKNITEIIQDPYGNYAITTALEVSCEI
jgi:Pumilio-family RNA binding repeat